MKSRLCELCTEEASLYCESDSAFLCWNCDSKVHGANFLVARHIRRTVCSKCNGFDGNCMSGIKLRPFQPICLSCSSDSDGVNQEEEEEDIDSSAPSALYSSSSSSDCISTTAESFTFSALPKTRNIKKKDKKISPSSSVTDVSGYESSFPVSFDGGESSFPANFTRDLTDVDEKVGGVLVNSFRKLGKVTSKKMKTDGIKRMSKDFTNVDSKAEVILVNWSNKLGLKSNYKLLTLASHALHACLEKLTFLPFKVAIASSFWFSLKILSGTTTSTCQNLKRFEEICGVPVKLIMLGESKISRVLNLNRRCNNKIDLEEGWAEC